MYRPLRIFLGFIAVILLIDAIVLGLLVSPWFFAGVSVIAAIVWCWKPENKAIETGDEGWDLGQGVDLENPQKPRPQRVVLQDKVLKLGFLGLGAPGAGKTVSLAIGLIYYYSVQYFERTKERLGWAYLEGKGDKEIYQLAVAVGAEPDLFFSSELDGSDEMNLFDGKAKDLIDIWSRILVPANTNEFYGNEQKRVLQIAIPLLKDLAAAKNKPAALRDLYALLRHPEAPIEVLAEARAHGLDSSLIAQADDYFKGDYKDRQDAIKGLMNRLFLFVDGTENNRINSYNPKIVLSEVVKSGKRIYFHLPLTNYSKDLALAVSENFAAIARDRQNYEKNRQLFPMTFDDWGGFFYDGFSKATARIRSAGMPANFFFQSKGQMDEIDPTFSAQIDDTVATKVFLRLSGDDTRQWASRMMGTYENTSFASMGRQDSGDSQTMGLQRIPRVEPEEFRNLNDGEAIIATSFKQNAGEVISTNVKVRFPLAPTSMDSDSIEWPECQPLEEKEGLGLWDKYMRITPKSAPVEDPIGKTEAAEKNDTPSDLAQSISEEIDEW